MANVTICDRCGVILKRFTTGLVNIDISRDVTTFYFTSTRRENLHLCNACYDAFGEFLREHSRGEDTKED